jgi:hypothetical protein
MAARTLRALRTHDKGATIRVIGTNAVYAYETLAGVVFNSESRATGDTHFDDRGYMIEFVRPEPSPNNRAMRSQGLAGNS